MRTDRRVRPAGLACALLAIAVTAAASSRAAQPEWIVNRKPLPACGEEMVVRGDTDVEARQCLLEAYRDGEDAELISTDGHHRGKAAGHALHARP